MTEDLHYKLCIGEHTKPNPLPCQFCRKESDAYASDVDGWLCVDCFEKTEDTTYGEPEWK